MLNGDGVGVLGFVDDDELARLYRGALCVAYTSLYEGFGIPVLEALACGAPVVTSAGTAMEEVADGTAVLVDPLDPDSIVAGIHEAIGRATSGGARARRASVLVARERRGDGGRLTEVVTPPLVLIDADVLAANVPATRRTCRTC